jgi:ribosomal protein S18 acetylase RimI-like enzyme
VDSPSADRDRIKFLRRQKLRAEDLDALFTAAWGLPKPGYERVFAHSFTWITASSGDDLVGFANVAWDGDVHFFLLDTTVHPAWQGKGIGHRLVREAIEACREHGAWLHVDASQELMSGFYQPCGFELTPAGLVNLTRVAPGSSP